MLQTFGERALEQRPGIEEAVLLEEFVHLIHRQVSVALVTDEIDIEAIELMLRGVAHALLYDGHFAVWLYVLVRVGAAEHLAEDVDAPRAGIPAHHFLSESDDPVAVSFEQFGIVVELLVSLQQGRTLGKPHALSVTEKTRVGAMHFFLHHIFQVGGHLCHDLLHELPAEGVLDGVVLLEF